MISRSVVSGFIQVLASDSPVGFPRTSSQTQKPRGFTRMPTVSVWESHCEFDSVHTGYVIQRNNFSHYAALHARLFVLLALAVTG